MPDHVNPFPNDPDRRCIWEMLVLEDIAAFVAGDFSRVRGHFAAERFVGYDACRSARPDDWKITFPTLADYEARWVESSREFRAHTLAGGQDLGTFLHQLTDLREIEISGSQALAHKKFNGRTRTVEGAVLECLWQTLYLLARDQGEWKITGLIGYLPYASSPPLPQGEAGPLKRPPAGSRQHPNAGPYSPVLVLPAGRMVVLSGQGPLDPRTGRIVGTTLAEQTAVTLENCRRQLAEAAATFDDVFQVRAYLAAMREWEAFNSVYREHFRAPYPVRTTIQAVLWGGIRVEVDMTAMLSS